MVARDVAYHHLFEAQPAIVPESLDHRIRATHEELGLARAAIALGEDLVHFGARRGVARRHEDVPPQHGPGGALGACGRLAIDIELTHQFVVGHVLPGEPAVAVGARALHRGRHGAREPDLHGDARPRAHADAVEGEVAAAEAHALTREQPAKHDRELLQPPGTARHGDAEGVERLRPPAVREGHDKRRLREGREGADLLGEHDGLVEGGEEHHAHGHDARHRHETRQGGDGGEAVRIGARDRVIVAEEQAVEPRLPCRGGDLEHVPRLLRGVEGAHGALDESPRRERREDLLESLVGLGPRGIEEAKCRASSQHRRHISLRYSWTNWTTMEPSPTAEATRLIEPDRTSPAAKTPGRLVSSRKGWRRTFQCGESKSRGPVRTKSLASFSISGGNHSVRGTAPMKLKRAGHSKARRWPVSLLSSSTRRRVPSPERRFTSVWSRTSMMGISSIRDTRYAYMSLCKLSPRTTRYTLRACPERYTAAWPAELPPPTTTTSALSQALASFGVAA